jgi:hypothetical protein
MTRALSVMLSEPVQSDPGGQDEECWDLTSALQPPAPQVSVWEETARCQGRGRRVFSRPVVKRG